MDKELQKIKKLEEQLKEAKKDYLIKKAKEEEKIFLVTKPQLYRFKNLCSNGEFKNFHEMIQFFEEYNLTKLKDFFID